MAPIPIQTSHVLSFGYSIAGLTHHTRFLVDAVASADSTGFSLHCEFSADVGLSTVITQFAAVFGPLIGSGGAAAGVTLYSVSGTVLTPVYSGSWTFTPSGSPKFTAVQYTWFFRDGLGHPAKVVVLEGVDQPPFKTNDISSMGASAVKTFSQDLADSSAGHIGAWMKSRSDGFPDRFISLVLTLNRRVRRRRGLA